MTLPANGATFKEAHQKYLNAAAIFKGTITHLIARDNMKSLTDLTNPAAGLCADGVFSPIAEDGDWRDDLYDPDFPGGQWYSGGLIEDSGSKFSSDFGVEKVMTAQLIRPARWDETSQENELAVTFDEFLNEVVAALRDNLPLATNVRDLGQPGRAWKAPSTSTRARYQIAVLAEDGDSRAALVIPCVARKKVGDLEFNRKNPAQSPLTWGVEEDPFTDIPYYIVTGGAGVSQLAGAPVFAGLPVATVGGAGAASVVFTVPTLPHDPAPDTFTYSWEVKNGAGPWATAVPAGTTAAGITVTSSFTGLTAGATQFRVTATSESGLSTTSQPSVAVTIS